MLLFGGNRSLLCFLKSTLSRLPNTGAHPAVMSNRADAPGDDFCEYVRIRRSKNRSLFDGGGIEETYDFPPFSNDSYEILPPFHKISNYTPRSLFERWIVIGTCLCRKLFPDPDLKMPVWFFCPSIFCPSENFLAPF